jgi:hypothetical protein
MLSGAGYKSGGHFAKEAVSQHETHDHPGKQKTKIKFSSGGSVDGMDSGGRADRAPRGRGKVKGKGGKTVVNVLNMQHPGAGGGLPPGAPPPRPPMPPPGAMAGGPPPPMGGPPPGLPPGGPMKRGGRASEDGIDTWRNPIKGANADQAKRGGKTHKSKRPHAEFKRGGKIPHLTGGSGGGRGRLEKAAFEATQEGGKRACGGKS